MGVIAYSELLRLQYTARDLKRSNWNALLYRLDSTAYTVVVWSMKTNLEDSGTLLAFNIRHVQCSFSLGAFLADRSVGEKKSRIWYPIYFMGLALVFKGRIISFTFLREILLNASWTEIVLKRFMVFCAFYFTNFIARPRGGGGRNFRV